MAKDETGRQHTLEHSEHESHPKKSSDEVIGFVAELQELPKGKHSICRVGESF
jgi:hypothetical protein